MDSDPPQLDFSRNSAWNLPGFHGWPAAIVHLESVPRSLRLSCAGKHPPPRRKAPRTGKRPARRAHLLRISSSDRANSRRQEGYARFLRHSGGIRREMFCRAGGPCRAEARRSGKSRTKFEFTQFYRTDISSTGGAGEDGEGVQRKSMAEGMLRSNAGSGPFPKIRPRQIGKPSAEGQRLWPPRDPGALPFPQPQPR